MGIAVERYDGGVAVVTLSEEASRNALSRALIHEICLLYTSDAADE